ncbi:MAG: hypothetical protein FJ286_09405 [Planctomycetes bacterium]|nr:hypothetical protein [Planctomycetota bacterium]
MRSDIRLAVTMSLAAAAIGVADPFAAIAAPITPGNLVIYRVGDGVSGTLSALGTAVFLDEYTTAGSLVQTIPVPTTGTTQQMVAVGNASTEGIISRSRDGAKLVFMGYRNTTGVTPGGSTVPRVIGTLDVAGTLDTSIAVTDMTSAVPRSATTVDGSRYWLATSTGVRYVPTPIASSTSVLIDSRNSRQVNLADNVLYATNGSTGTAAKVQSYGTLPTVSTTPTPLVTTLTTDAMNGFALLDLDAGIPGVDTMYTLSTVSSQLLKYSSNGTSWLTSGSIASSGIDLAATNVGGAVTLYLTTGSNLRVLTDTSGYNATITGSFTTLATAATNTAFRGVGLFAVPEPSMYAMVVAAAACGGARMLRRRGRGR